MRGSACGGVLRNKFRAPKAGASKQEPGLLKQPSVHLAERDGYFTAALGVFWDPVAFAVVEGLLFIHIMLQFDGLEATAAREHQQKGGEKKQGRFHGTEDARSS